MTTTLSTILISGASEELTARIEQLIRSQAELSLVKSVTPDEAANEDFKAKLIWIELESNPDGNIALLEQLIKVNPNSFFVVSKEDLEPELVKKAMQVGALDFLDHKGWAAQIRSVVRRIMAKEFGSKPTQGSAMSAASRQPTRPGTWGQLNSLKVSPSTPSTSGFRRVEPGKPVPPVPTAAAPAQAPAAPPPPPPKPEPEPDVVEVEEEDTTGEIQGLPGEEAPADEEAAEGSYEEPGYAEQAEGEYTGEEQGYAEGEYPAAEQGYAEGEYASDEQGYDAEQTEGEYTGEEQGYAEQAEGEYATDEQGYAEQAEGEYATDEQGYAEQAAGEYATDEQGYAGQAEGEYATDEQGYEEAPAEGSAEYNYEQGAEETGEAAAEIPAEEEIALEEEQPQQFSDDEESDTSAGAEPEPAKPAAKGRWDELDSIISQKSDDKKGASKWGELASIPTPKAVQKDLSTSQAAGKTANKWGELDSIGTPAAKDAPSSLENEVAASAGNKWGDLDAIGSRSGAKEPTSAAGKAASKWGDLNALGSKSSAPAEDAGDTSAPAAGNKWGDLEAIGGKSSAAKEPAAPSNKWGDLESIGQPKAFKREEDDETKAGGGNKWGNLDSIGSPKKEAEPTEGAKKWGNLDSLGSKSGGLKSNTRSFIKPKTDDQTAAAGNAASAAGAGASAGTGATGKSKWGDLDALGAKSSGVEPATTGGAAKWGDLEAIGSPGAGATEGLGGGKWGNLNSIPTPKGAQETSAQWTNLDSIPTPKATPEAPSSLIEGSLPTAQITNEASQKWKSGMSSELSTGARQVGEMRDKLKGQKVAFKIGWNNVNIVLAVAIIASVGWLGTQFFTYPEPPQQVAGK